MPDAAALAKGYTALAFNVHYWKTIDATLTIPGLDFLPSLTRKRPQDGSVDADVDAKGEYKRESKTNDENDMKRDSCTQLLQLQQQKKKQRKQSSMAQTHDKPYNRSDSMPMLETMTLVSSTLSTVPLDNGRLQTQGTVPRFNLAETESVVQHNVKPSSFVVHKTVQTTLSWSTSTQQENDDAGHVSAQNQARLVYSKKPSCRGSKRKYGDDKLVADVQVQTFDIQSRDPVVQPWKRFKYLT